MLKHAGHQVGFVGKLGDGLELLLRSVLAGVPYQWHSEIPIARYEGNYATVLYTYFQSVTAHVTAEDSSSAGR